MALPNQIDPVAEARRRMLQTGPVTNVALPASAVAQAPAVVRAPTPMAPAPVKAATAIAAPPIKAVTAVAAPTPNRAFDGIPNGESRTIGNFIARQFGEPGAGGMQVIAPTFSVGSAIDNYLNRGHSFVDSIAAASADARAQTDSLQANTGALVGKSAANFDDVKASLMPKTVAAEVAERMANARLIGEQANVVGPVARANIAESGARAGATTTAAKVAAYNGLPSNGSVGAEAYAGLPGVAELLAKGYTMSSDGTHWNPPGYVEPRRKR